MTATPQQFLNELKVHNAEQFKIVTTLRTLVLKNKTATEKIKYGGLLYSDQSSSKESYTGLFVYKNHITMEFSDGFKLTDTKDLLGGGGKFRRHLKFTAREDIDEKEVEQFLQQAVKITKSES